MAFINVIDAKQGRSIIKDIEELDCFVEAIDEKVFRPGAYLNDEWKFYFSENGYQTEQEAFKMITSRSSQLREELKGNNVPWLNVYDLEYMPNSDDEYDDDDF